MIFRSRSIQNTTLDSRYFEPLELSVGRSFVGEPWVPSRRALQKIKINKPVHKYGHEIKTKARRNEEESVPGAGRGEVWTLTLIRALLWYWLCRSRLKVTYAVEVHYLDTRASPCPHVLTVWHVTCYTRLLLHSTDTRSLNTQRH